MRRTILTVLIFIVPAILLGGSLQRRTVWHGVYTDAQAIEGERLYAAECRRCHGGALEGGSAFPLVGEHFMEAWREDNLESLFTFIKTSMPPRAGNPLSDESTLAIMTFILWSNYFPAGSTALTLNDLPAVQIEGQEGPRPLPSTALIQTVGCMTKAEGDAWDLTYASNPSRTRKSDKSTPEELKAAENRSLGSQTMRMQNFAMLGSFNPEAHAGSKMLAKGVLLRQPDGNLRLSLTALAPISQSCR